MIGILLSTGAILTIGALGAMPHLFTAQWWMLIIGTSLVSIAINIALDDRKASA